MSLTRRMICEQIQYRLAGGEPSADFEPRLDEINTWLTHAIPATAMKAYTEAVQINGVESVPDGFYTLHKGLPVSSDEAIGLFYVTLPSTPYGLPRGYDITAAWMQSWGKLGLALIRIDEKHLGMYTEMPRPLNSIVYWMDGNVMRIDSPLDLTGKMIAVRMAAGVSNDGLDQAITIPPDYTQFLIEYVMRWFAPGAGQSKDMSNDGQNVK